MRSRSSLDRLPHALARASEHWHARRPAEAGPAFSIALSREVGARGTSVARELGTRLGWHVYDHELLERIAQEMNLRVSLLESVDERRISWLRECVEALAAVPHVSELTYVRHLVETLLSLSTHGECVIVGRGAAQVLPAETTLRVRLVAALEDRIAVMSQELGVSKQEAARHIEATERERVRFIKDHFKKDPIDPENYDLILNSSRFSVAECAAIIIEALRRLQARVTGKGSATAGKGV